MTPTRSEESIVGRLAAAMLDELSGQWRALGVSVAGKPPTRMIDLEALLAASALVGQYDRRLVELAKSWAAENREFVNLQRYKRVSQELLATTDPPREALLDLGEMQAALKVRARLEGHRAGSRHLGQLRLDDPSHAGLRVRAALGTTARAEILSILLSTYRAPKVTELTRRIRLTRRAVTDALQSLEIAGLATWDPSTGPQLLHRDELMSALGPAATSADMVDRYSVVLAALFGGDPSSPSASNLLRMRRLVAKLESKTKSGELPMANLDETGTDFALAYVDWLLEMARSLSPTQLYEPGARGDYSPSLSGEPVAVFLGRVAGPVWDRVRNLLDEWYAEAPEGAKRDLKARLSATDDRQFYGAFWELYVHEWFRRQGFEAESHPVIPRGQSRPDFLFRQGRSVVVVECSGLLKSNNELARSRRVAPLLDALNSVRTRSFFLDVEVEEEGWTTPPTRGVRGEVEDWLRSLDEGSVRALLANDGIGTLPEHVLRLAGWVVRLRPIPRSDETSYADRAIGIYPNLSETSPGRDLRHQLSRRLKLKTANFAETSQPLVIAMLVHEPATFPQDTSALLDGLHLQAPEAASAVLVAVNLFPWNVGTVSPTLIRNQEARYSLPAQVGVTGSPSALFGLSVDWPGPEKPF